MCFSDSIALQKSLAENGFLSLVFGLNLSAMNEMATPNIIVFVISLKCTESRLLLLSVSTNNAIDRNW